MALYGLKHAPWEWYSRIGGYYQSMGFTIGESYPKLSFILLDVDILILSLYVNAVFLIALENLVANCEEYMEAKFKMKGIDMMNYFLGLDFW